MRRAEAFTDGGARGGCGTARRLSRRGRRLYAPAAAIQLSKPHKGFNARARHTRQRDLLDTVNPRTPHTCAHAQPHGSSRAHGAPAKMLCTHTPTVLCVRVRLVCSSVGQRARLLHTTWQCPNPSVPHNRRERSSPSQLRSTHTTIRVGACTCVASPARLPPPASRLRPPGGVAQLFHPFVSWWSW